MLYSVPNVLFSLPKQSFKSNSSKCSGIKLRDHFSSLKDTFETSNEKIHEQNLEFLSKEIFKFANGLSPSIMNGTYCISKYF